MLEAGTALAGTAEEPALAGFERGVVARAFHSLPERWQAVLWHTEVEGLTPGGDRARSWGSPPTASPPWRTARARVCGRRTSSSTCRTRSTRGAARVAGKLGAYVRGGLGTRETAQVEAHLEDCGTCRGLLLELGDVNHGMRAVIAPLVLGLLGMGALGVALPVGGGLAAGAAAARRPRVRPVQERGGAARPVSGTAAGAAASDRDGHGRRRRSRGRCGSRRRRGGVPGRDPARRRCGRRGRRGARRGGRGRHREPARVPGRRDRRSGTERQRVPERPRPSRRRARRCVVPTPQPTDVPTPEPSDLLADDLLLDDEDDVGR